MEKDHMEILLEDMNSKLELVLEGQTTLIAKVEAFRQESNRKHDDTNFQLRAIITKFNAPSQ